VTQTPDVSNGSGGVAVHVERQTRRAITTYILSILGVIVAVAFVSQTGLVRERRPPAFAAMFALASAAIGAFEVVRLRRSHVVLYPDGIEVVRYPWRPRRIARIDIAGRRFHLGGWRKAPYHVLVTRTGESVPLPPYLENNAALRAWLKDVPLQTRTRA
jgi:hypothetical protein